jgi:catechol 2,3-dioxygenase-like lactoylglutathione lyase family enzyme
MIVGMNRFTVIAENRQKTLDFYVGLLGLTEGYRPDLGFDGAWLYGGGNQTLTVAAVGHSAEKVREWLVARRGVRPDLN